MALLHGLNLDDRSPGEAWRAICTARQNGQGVATGAPF